jgi:exosortase E/protease (VPEID-CTERM system)
MHSSASVPASAPADRFPWRTLLVAAGVFAVEAAGLLVVFHRELVAIPIRALDVDPFRANYVFKWLIVTGLAIVVAALAAVVRRHPAEYRSLPLSGPRLAAQVAAFAAVAAWLEVLSTGRLRPVLGNRGELLLGAAAAAAWLVATLALVVPRLALARRFTVDALLVAAAALVAWQVGELTTGFWHATGGTTMRLVETLLTPLAGGPVVRPEEFVIGTKEFQVSVGATCGGFRGIGLMALLIAGYLWWFRRIHRFPQSFLLFPVGLALIWLANVLRITALILVGIHISPAIAVDGFHSTAGWLAFLAVGLGTIWTASRMPFFTVAAEPPAGVAAAGLAAGLSAGPTAGPTAASSDAASPGVAAATLPAATACLVPFIALMAVTLLTRAFTSGFDLFYPLRVVAVAAALFACREQLRWREFRIAPGAVAIGAAAFVAWMLLAPGPADPQADLTAARDPFLALGRPWGTVWLVFRCLGAIVTVPAAEELAFRGFLLHRLIDEDVDGVPPGRFTWPSFLASSLAFGSLHGGAWLAGTVAGAFFAVALYRRRRLADAVVAHATTNALLTASVVATGSWSSWG